MTDDFSVDEESEVVNAVLRDTFGQLVNFDTTEILITFR